MTIRSKTIRYAQKIKRENDKEENRLNREISQLQKETMGEINVLNKTKVKTLQQKQQELVDLRRKKIEGVMIRSRIRWYEKGEKNNSFFFTLKNEITLKKE